MPGAHMGGADVVVVGSWPGGATLARRIAPAGKKVVLLGRGKDLSALGAVRHVPRCGDLRRSRGTAVHQRRAEHHPPVMAGGAASTWGGWAARSPTWLRHKYGVDIDRHVDDMYPVVTALKSFRYPLTRPRWGNTLGVTFKLNDDVSGSLASERNIGKLVKAGDRTKLDHASGVARHVLAKAGAEPGSMFITPHARHTHLRHRPHRRSTPPKLADRDRESVCV